MYNEAVMDVQSGSYGCAMRRLMMCNEAVNDVQ